MSKQNKEGGGRRGYPTDVSDQEWEFCAPYLTLMDETAPQRAWPLRDIFNALRWQVRAGCPWRMMPNDLPDWTIVYQQAQRWFKAGCFEAMAHDLRLLLRLKEGRKAQPSASNAMKFGASSARSKRTPAFQTALTGLAMLGRI